ncbi:MAG: hypothetical protein AB7O38_16720 [Pirellulaceae bacterium]
MRWLGRLLQIAGLIILPLAMALELVKDWGLPFGLKDMLLMLVFGATLFYTGRLLEGHGRS